MNTWNVTVRVQVARRLSDPEASQLGRLAGEPLGQVVLVSTRDDATIGVTVAADTTDPVAVVAQLRAGLTTVLAERGHEVVSWQAFEALTPMETDRRLETAVLPPLINTEAFAALAGVSRQRISELESLRRAAAERGEPYSFPVQVVPGWWLKSAAEHWAATRKRKPGPVPRGEQSLFARATRQRPPASQMP